MFTQSPEASEFSEAWIEGDERGRWRSASGHGAGVGAHASGSSVLEIEPGCLLPRGNAGEAPLRFWAIYAATDVTTTYDEPVQPGGERERDPLG